MLRAVLRFIYFACDSAFAGSDHNAFVLLCLPTAVFIWVDVGPILLHGKFTFVPCLCCHLCIESATLALAPRSNTNCRYPGLTLQNCGLRARYIRCQRQQKALPREQLVSTMTSSSMFGSFSSGVSFSVCRFSRAT